MKIRKIEDNFYVSDQIMPADLAALAQSGICTIICNRPDGEGEDQPDFATLQQKARQYNIDMLYIPVTLPAITPAALENMATALQQAKRPLLAFCKTGTRSETLYRHIKEAE